ncbi:general secretion pathway protein A [Steroidobacter denitrificans]|uniref:General secretion pathway protein A n=1 Tax=Steroidobacter denitrificans TaxID=465721 RepID=A0A127F7P4_STEDE|nr:ExeA family protein [Steroidobacter denitrificans]AMN45559.1 general secretion pathway protein A [Steroidobacter denitrificans]
MYTSFFGLDEKPFAITPDPRYLFMSERHAEALAHLLYGITEAGGFIQLTGEVGTGKTTVVRSLLERMPGHADVAVILNPQLTPLQFVLTICEELGIFMRDEDVASIKDLVDVLNKRLLDAHAKGRRIVVIVDEAQNLTPQTLEQVRLLTNLETASQKLLQIILIGQPELRELLGRNELRQLAQRITGRYHLDPLSKTETAAYVTHRLKIAGANGEIFTPAALRTVHTLSQGVPRIINVICDRALLGAFTRDTHCIGPALVRHAAGEVYGRRFGSPWMKALALASIAVAAAGVTFGLWQLHSAPQDDRADRTQAALHDPVAAAESITTAAMSSTGTAPQAEEPGPIGPATAAAEMDIAMLLEDQPHGTSTENAFAQLFSLWGGHFDPARGRPCDQALQQGLQCVYQQGSWGQLRTLNRPAILTLIDDHGNAHQVVVAELRDGAATIKLPEAQQTVSVASISRLWYGDYLVLWRPQVTGAHSLSAGMQGENVRWLRAALNTVRGQPAAANTSDYYDEELVRMVEDFQRRYRLTVDGVAGVQTQLVLDTLSNTGDAPLLLTRTDSVQGSS